MKKVIISILVVIGVIFILFSAFNIEIGGVTIGKANDLQTKQSKNFNASKFNTDYFSKDHLVVLNLWATWCEPCVEEMPLLNSIKAKYNKHTIDFISLSVDKDSLKLVKFNAMNKFDFKDITLENLKYRNAILNTLENKKTDSWISSYQVPITYLIKNKKVLEKIDGTVDEEELVALIEQYK